MSENEKNVSVLPSDAPEKKPQPERLPWYKRPLIAGVVIIAFIALVVVAVLSWLHSRTYEETDDAYIDVQSQFVSPQISGRVLHVLAQDNQDVKEDDVLVEIDPADYQSRLDQAIAGQTQAQAQVAQAEAQAAIYEAQVGQADANMIVAEVNATNAADDLRRYLELRKSITGAVSQQQLDTSTTQSKSLAAQVDVAKKSAVAARAQLAFSGRQIEAARAALKSSDAQAEQARLNLSYTKIKAHLNGRVANKSVADGNYMQAGTELMAIVPTNVYVTANFKETQLTKMRLNQAVEIVADAYPDYKLRGHVDSIQPGSGQVFSVLPAQNATGNWVKIVQRVPVKIIIDNIPDDPGRRLSPGMSVEVKALLR
jgi:membrane fusion protein (multidrug efflux system)